MPVSVPPPTRGHAGLTGVGADPIQETRSFEPPAARRARAPMNPPKPVAAAEASTRRGTPRPDLDRQIASVRVVTGDYRKVDDNEIPRPRVPSQTSLAAITQAPPANAARIAEPIAAASTIDTAQPTIPAAVLRHAWLQGAAVGALGLGIAWVVWLIARAG